MADPTDEKAHSDNALYSLEIATRTAKRFDAGPHTEDTLNVAARRAIYNAGRASLTAHIASLESALTAAEERAGRAEGELAERETDIESGYEVRVSLRAKLAEIERALRVARGVSDGSADNTKRLYGENASLRSQLAAYRTVVEAAWEWQRFAIKKAGTYADAVNATRGLNAALDALPAPSESAKGEPSAPVWSIYKIAPGVGRLWLRRDKWQSQAIAGWSIDPAHALTFPTKAEAIMFAREYLPELESDLEFAEQEPTR
jgi:hypothetical protein